MCGIAGIIRLDGQPVDPIALDRLTDALAHRGPDGRGTVLRGPVGLGHRRLSIVDRTDAASQPMTTEDGNLSIVFNGEIYNFQSLRASLQSRGHAFRSQGDTEVLLRLWAHEGPRSVERLRGMFAFAVHDRRQGTVTLVRDRVGKKPLKYFQTPHFMAFASEWKALRTLPECPRTVDVDVVTRFLTLMYVPAPDTGIVGIRKLAPGTMLTVDLATGNIHEPRTYWRLDYRQTFHRSIGEWTEAITQVFDESVRLRMIADVPVGAFLSGGIDSAAVVAAMSRQTSHPVHTFSIGTSEKSHNELPYADITARHFGCHHHPIIVAPDIVRLLPTLVAQYEEPFADPSTIPTYLLARETRSYVTVALNGDGGDENFAGYVRYPILRCSLLWERFPSFFHTPVRLAALGLRGLVGSTFSYRLARFETSMPLPWPERFLQYISFFTDEEKRRLFRSEYQSFERTDTWWTKKTASARALANHPIEQAIAMDIATYLEGDLLPKVDLGTMAHGLEARSPFLDHVLLELTATMPLHYKLRGFQRKWILRHLLRGTIPHDILTKPKTGFRLPLNAWFRTDLRSFVEDRLLSEDSKLWQWMDRRAMEHFIRDVFRTRIDYSDHLWALLWLDEWLRQYA